eukprot:g51258.t1
MTTEPFGLSIQIYSLKLWIEREIAMARWWPRQFAGGRGGGPEVCALNQPTRATEDAQIQSAGMELLSAGELKTEAGRIKACEEFLERQKKLYTRRQVPMWKERMEQLTAESKDPEIVKRAKELLVELNKPPPAQGVPKARMLFESSGRQGFEPLPYAPSPDMAKAMPDRERLKAMLLRERELRLSPETQALFDLTGGGSCDGVYLDVQGQVAQEFGLSEEAGIYAIRTVAARFPNDKELLSIPYYVRYNRSRQGKLHRRMCLSRRLSWVGDAAPDAAPLLRLDGRPCKLSTFGGVERPLVVVAGSIS